MVKKENINLKRRYYIFFCLALVLIIFGGILGASLAYIQGEFNYTQEATNPYLKSEIYYNSTKINENGITGVISNAGEVSVTINGETTINASENVISLPLSIKNSGNIDGDLSQLTIFIEFYSAGDLDTSVENAINSTSYYLTLNANTGYTISNNSSFSFSNISLIKNETNSSQFLTSLSISPSIVNSDLCGKNFKIKIVSTLIQDNFDSIN